MGNNGTSETLPYSYYLIELINTFGSWGGFDLIIKRIEKAVNPGSFHIVKLMVKAMASLKVCLPSLFSSLSSPS
jgi:hypothetical protein